MKISQQEHEYGYIREDKIYLKGFLDYPDRQIGMVKESEEASIKYFENRFQIAKQKVLDLENLIEEAQNKGSYLMKLVHMRKYLANFDGLGDYVSLFEKLDGLELQLRGLISTNRVKNLEIKQALLQEGKEISEMEDYKEATELMKELKLKWIKTGSVVKQHHDDVEDTFQNLYTDFFERKKNLAKERARLAKDNVRKYRTILYQADQLKNSDDFENTFQEFRRLQQEWKTAGKIPHKKAVRLWEKFKDSNDFFFNRYKKFKAFKEEYPEQEAEEIKVELAKKMCNEAETVVTLEGDVNSEKTKELLIEWKKLTSVFRNIDRDVSDRFRNACDKVFELSYLMRVVKRKYPMVNTKPKEDQLRIKISFMRELIRRDEAEINANENDLRRANTRFNKHAASMENNLRTQKRKLGVKREIIGELEQKLSLLKK